MVTTIQLSEDVKNALGKMKETSRESFEDVIVKLINIVQEQKRLNEELLIEGCKEMAKNDLKICEEFKYAEAEIECEWDGDL
ncbi:MAG: hypothetical protein QT05_C0013G0006 [archaeon GW2011_AR13]|nr:MAG: hypothetical protein QT05_C0013G0006 [archaeon GW2011_AR13]HIG94995.1 hypothetical protein [Nanoarchaeota archaeon]HIH62893.1 hypothetical protein [Nanoarchaeota archaeon]HIJ10310.1 hypothetical protein [Nanoarchaeota archaeon]